MGREFETGVPLWLDFNIAFYSAFFRIKRLTVGSVGSICEVHFFCIGSEQVCS